MEERLKKAEQHGFSRNEAQQLLKFSKILASKTIKNYLIKFVQDSAENIDKNSDKYFLYKKLINKLNKISAEDFSGYQETSFEDKNEALHRLRYQLSIVPDNYEITIRAEERFIPSLLHYLDKFTDIAAMYYQQTVQENGIIKDLAEFFPNLDVSQLHMNKYTRTLYLDENYPHRIGVLCFYVDANGNPCSE